MSRCKSVTENGNQCKRDAFLGGRYCWQHTPRLAKWAKGMTLGALITTILAVIGLVADIGGIYSLISGQRTPRQEATPIAFRTATQGESLVIIARFDDRSEGQLVGVDPSSSIYDFVLKAAQDNVESSVRVERFEQAVTNSQDAQRVGEQYGARLVIWGWYNSLGATPYAELIGIRTVQGEGVALETPTPMAFYFLTEIPSQSAYLGLFMMGMTHIVVESSVELRQAIAFFDAATRSIVEGTRVKPWEAYVWRANCYAWLGEYEIAVQDYDRSLALNPEDASGYFNRGYAHAALGDQEAAIADLDKAIELDLEYPSAYYNRGFAYNRLGEYKKALADYSKAVELDPEYGAAYTNRAYTYLRMNENVKALADLDQAIELDPEDAEAYINRGHVLVRLGRPKEAIQEFEQVLALGSEYTVEAYAGLGGTYSELGDYEAAFAALDKTVELDPQYWGAHFNRGYLYAEKGQVEKAIADFERVLELSTDPSWREQAQKQLEKLRGQ